jgi:protein CMS1
MLVLPSLHTRLSQKSKSKGAPTLLYIASAALRVADVTRILKDKKLRGEKGGDVAKLFAKHFKLAQHVTYLKRTNIGSAVGTPGRLGKLLNEESKFSANIKSKISLINEIHFIKKRSTYRPFPILFWISRSKIQQLEIYWTSRKRGTRLLEPS